MSHLRRLQKNQLIKPPPPSYVVDGLIYETITGSQAYGCADTTKTSDTDIYGVCIPDKEIVFPHAAGHIEGFGRQRQRFNCWQRHHLLDAEGKEYDFQVYNIVDYFQLVMACNPNLIDSIYTPQRCVTWITPIGQIMRDNRRLFLSKKAFHSFRGYSFQQLHKMKIKKPEQGSKRAETVEKFGYDVKFATHLIRLLEECRQILTDYDLDLESNSEQLKSVRRGDWKEADVYRFFEDQSAGLEKLVNESKIPHSPDEKAIRGVLMQCLEAHFGSLSDVITIPDRHYTALAKIKEILHENGI